MTYLLMLAPLLGVIFLAAVFGLFTLALVMEVKDRLAKRKFAVATASHA